MTEIEELKERITAVERSQKAATRPHGYGCQMPQQTMPQGSYLMGPPPPCSICGQAYDAVIHRGY